MSQRTFNSYNCPLTLTSQNIDESYTKPHSKMFRLFSKPKHIHVIHNAVCGKKNQNDHVDYKLTASMHHGVIEDKAPTTCIV